MTKKQFIASLRILYNVELLDIDAYVGLCIKVNPQIELLIIRTSPNNLIHLFTNRVILTAKCRSYDIAYKYLRKYIQEYCE